ncbi:hypothetical protein DCAR_0624973 [Daucus carota subsp. sativus]|uniref:Uncharacterized protein n=1 Tax=Daucus carota subsp. sativus TaxID=79200 RepID=A0AAF1B3S0_DAUCS|nr:hypothetical protein DCAR_0624973 [Daucus carota subsp. sativus]
MSRVSVLLLYVEIWTMTSFFFSFHLSSQCCHRLIPLFNVGISKKTVGDVKREELEALLDGHQIRDVDYPEGHFGTKKSPALIKSYYDKRIIGCPGPDGEDEHDIVWLWLEKGKPRECPVCSQYFELEVVAGPGGSPDGHDDENQH